MAYCNHCGAYIPDGQTVCLACGAGASAGGSAQAAQAAPNGQKADSGDYSYSYSNQDLREQLEKRRQEQKEKSERWAEQQAARRRQQEESRRWAEEEYARRQAEQEQQEEERRQAQQRRLEEEARRRAAATAYRSVRSDSGSEGTGRILGALSYLSILFILPRIFTPDDYFARYHARQGLKLFIFGILANVVGSLTGFGWILLLARLYFIYKGMSNALNGREEPLPYIGKIGDS